jgi:predicted dehydrogenase
MDKAARTNGVILKTGFNHRHHPAIFEAHALLSEGAIGQVYYARCIYGHGGRPGYEKEWRAGKDISGGGELLDQGVHVVDLFRWFLGDFEEAVGYTQTCYWPMEVEDNAFAIFRTSGGRTAMMHTSWTQWKNRFTFEVYGEAGYLIVEGLGGSYGTEKLIIGRRPVGGGKTSNRSPSVDAVCAGTDQRSFPDVSCGESAPEKLLKMADEKDIDSDGMEKVKQQVEYLGGAPVEEIIVFGGPDISWELEWQEFTASIREKREPLGSGRDGLEANRMIAAVYLSAREHRPVKLKEV